MSFQDLEIRLQNFYKRLKTVSKKEKSYASVKSNVRYRVMEAYCLQNRKPAPHFFAKFFRSMIPSAFTLMILVSVFSFNENFNNSQTTVLAGKINQIDGAVEIIRGDKSFLRTQGPLEIFVGDVVKTTQSTTAQIEIIQSDQKYFETVAKSNTELEITDLDSLYLTKGTLKNKIFGKTEILTERSLIKSDDGGDFEIFVSPTGETTISPHKNTVSVSDLNNGKILLSAGEKISLRSDTYLNAKTASPLSIPSKKNQILAKLDISRSKLLTGVDQYSKGEKKLAQQNFQSAEKTYLSIAEILDQTNSQNTLTRKDLSLVEPSSIYFQIFESFKNDPQMIQESLAIETLFVILEQTKYQLAFSTETSDVLSFNRYNTLHNWLYLATPNQRAKVQILKQKYAQNFLRDINRLELRVDKIVSLSKKVDQLPVNSISQEFLQVVLKNLEPEYQSLLQEKMEAKYRVI